jgi:hypothetical protein
MHISNLVEAYLIDLLAGRTSMKTIIKTANHQDDTDGCRFLAYLLNHTFRSDIFMSEVIDAPPAYTDPTNEKETKLIRLVWKQWVDNNRILPLERNFNLIDDRDVMHHVLFQPHRKPPFHRDILDFPHFTEFRKAWTNTPKKDQKTIVTNVLPSAAVFHDLLEAMDEEGSFDAVYDTASKVFVVTKRELPRY